MIAHQRIEHRPRCERVRLGDWRIAPGGHFTMRLHAGAFSTLHDHGMWDWSHSYGDFRALCNPMTLHQFFRTYLY